jgi:hypothetical protein
MSGTHFAGDAMVGNVPAGDDICRAVDLYLNHAYADAPLPRRVAGVLSQLRQPADADAPHPLELPIWEHDANHPPVRYSLRLGNRVYPHMKLSLERRPDGLGYVFRVDGHDEVVRQSPAGRRCEEFREIVEADTAIAAAIEDAWDKAGLATIKSFLSSRATGDHRVWAEAGA